MNSVIKSIGIYLPERKVDNGYFESIVETSDEWIRQRTGIQSRFFADESQYTTDLCVNAVQNMSAQVDINSIDFIIVATSTPEHLIPSVASQVQQRLGIKHAGCLDVSAACAGFVYGIILAKV